VCISLAACGDDTSNAGDTSVLDTGDVAVLDMIGELPLEDSDPDGDDDGVSGDVDSDAPTPDRGDVPDDEEEDKDVPDDPAPGDPDTAPDEEDGAASDPDTDEPDTTDEPDATDEPDTTDEPDATEDTDAPPLACADVDGTCRAFCLRGEVNYQPANCRATGPNCCVPVGTSLCPPECRFIGTRSEGWYRTCDDERIRWDFCDGCGAACLYPGSRAEGYYDSCDGELIEFADCR